MWTNSKEYNRKNYKKYWWNPEAIKDRSDRNKARRKAWLNVWDSREVDHKNGNPNDNSKWNLRVISRNTNRKLWAEKANRRKWSWYSLNK